MQGSRFVSICLITAGIAVSGLSPSKAADSTLPPTVDAFVASANALAKSAGDPVDLGRATERLQAMRLELTKQLLAAKPGDTIRLDALDEVAILCNSRVTHVAITAQRNYIQSVAAKIDEVGKPSQIDNLTSAVKALFANQSLDIKGVVDEAGLKKATDAVQARCTSDIKAADKAYYGREVAPPPPGGNLFVADAVVPVNLLGLFGPIGSLVETIIGIITPVVVEGAKIVDEQKRRAVVLEFLKSPGNRKKIQDAGNQLASEISKFVLQKRQRQAGIVIEYLAVVRQTRFDLPKVSECKDYLAGPVLAKRPSGAPSDEFVVCWRTLWGKLSKNISAGLKAADDYDQLADAGDSDNASKVFEPLSKSLEAIAQNPDNMAEANITKIWAWATELIAFAEKVNTAASKENREKVQKAIDDLVNAFSGGTEAGKS